MSGSSSVFTSRWATLSYPSIFHGRSSSSTIYPAIHALHPQLDAFETHFCGELRRLQESGGYLSAEWLGQALDVCLSVHSQVEELFPHIRQEMLGQNSKWVNEHLEDTVKLLDVCNALRETISDIKQYHAGLELAVRCLQGSGHIGARQLLRARTALGSLKAKEPSETKSRMENCSSILRRMGEKFAAGAAPAGDGADFLEPIHASKALAVFVCGTLVAALSTKTKRSQPPSCVGQSAWAGALHGLQDKVKEEVEKRKTRGGGGARGLLQELDAVDSSSSSVYDLANKFINGKSVPLSEIQAVELRQSVQGLKKCVAELEDGMAPFERQINELFRVVVNGRMIFLDILSYS